MDTRWVSNNLLNVQFELENNKKNKQWKHVNFDKYYKNVYTHEWFSDKAIFLQNLNGTTFLSLGSHHTKCQNIFGLLACLIEMTIILTLFTTVTGCMNQS